MKGLDYKKIAKSIVDKHQTNICKTIQKGQSPDLYWSLEAAIEDALKYVAKNVISATRADIHRIIEEFDKNDGQTNN